MKLFGHPVHIMLIHFPTALLPMDFVCSVIAFYTQNVSLVLTAFYALAGGVAFGWLSMVFGILDLLKMVDSELNVLRKILVHGGINSLVITVFSVLAFLKIQQYPNLSVDSSWILALKMILLILMIPGNFLGGRLILKYKVAVENE